MSRLALIPLVLLLSACVPAYLVVRSAQANKASDACGALALQTLVGQPFPPSADLPAGARIIRPGDAVTEDFSETRLNVFLDSQDTVTSLTCG